MKKILLKIFNRNNEKLLLIGIPCLAIFMALFLLVPLLSLIFPSAPRLELDSRSDGQTILTDASEIVEEIKPQTEEAPAELTAEPIEPREEDRWTVEGEERFYLLPDGSKATGLRYIDGKIYYFDENGRCASSIGIDVSFYNSTVNWTAVKRAGVDFALIRIGGRGWGTGALYKDKLYSTYLNAAKAAGLRVGVYFYSCAANLREAREEAAVVLELLNGVMLDFPVYIDMEFSGDYPSGRADSLSMAERTQLAQAFCELIEKAGYEAGIYANESFYTVNLKYEELEQYSIWLASYTEDNALPDFSKRYDIWQISDRARLAGVSGTADLNVIF